MENNVEYECLICTKKVQQALMCPDCQKPICQECINHMNDMYMNKCPWCRQRINYIPINNDALLDNRIHAFKDPNMEDYYDYPECNVHNKILEYYCPKHEVLLCEECYYDHENCNVRAADKNQIEKLKEQYQGCINSLKDIVKKYQQKEKDINKKIRDYGTKVQEEFKKLMVQKKADIKTKAEELKVASTHKLTTKIINLEQYELQLKNLLNPSEDLNDVTRLEKFINIRNNIIETLNQYEEDIKEDESDYKSEMDTIIPGFFKIEIPFEISNNIEDIESTASFTHINKTWELYLMYKKDKNRNGYIAFQLKNIDKNFNVDIKITLIDLNGQMAKKNYEGRFLFDKENRNGYDGYENKTRNYIDLKIDGQELMKYSKVNDQNKNILKVIFAFKYNDIYYSDILN